MAESNDTLVTQFKKQLKIDGSDDDAYLGDLIAQAQGLIMEAVDGTQPLSSYEQFPYFDRAVALLVGLWYFNRTAASEGNVNELPYGVEPIINTLRGKLWGGGAHASDP
ncbi:MAG: head-tail connector protein [Sporolactobacillus sp.]